MANPQVKLTPEIKTRLDVLKSQNPETTYAQVIENLLNKETGDNSEMELLKKAASKVNLSLEKFIQAAALKMAAQVMRNTSSEVYQGADLKVHNAVEELKTKNQNAKNWFEKTEITQGRISEITGCNRGNITRYFKSHDVEIEKHHKDLNIEKGHNLKLARYLKTVE